MKQAGFQDSSQKHTKTPPMPTNKHGAKKHPANDRFGAKAEWQRIFIQRITPLMTGIQK